VLAVFAFLGGAFNGEEASEGLGTGAVDIEEVAEEL